MAYGVIRTDKVSGENVFADMLSFRFYNGATPAEVENGVIVELEGLDTNKHEIYKAKAATSQSQLQNCAVAAGVELMYDERKRSLDEFINEAGRPVRGYTLRHRNIYSFTKECFVGGTAPTKGASVGIGTGGKIDASGTGLGTCIDIDTAGKYTFYAIQIGAVAD